MASARWRGSFPDGWQPMGKAHTSAGRKWERDGAAERNCSVTTIQPPPAPALPAAGVRSRGEAVKLSLGKGEGKVLFWCLSLFLTTWVLIWTGKKLNSLSPSWVSFTHGSKWLATSLSVSRPMSLLILFPPPLPHWGGQMSEQLGRYSVVCHSR